MSEFLKNLEDAVNEGDFNSDAAKRINLIDDKADSAKGFTEKDHKVAEEIIATQAVPEEDVEALNSEYEEKMKIRAKEEILMATIVTMIDLEEETDRKLNELATFIQKQINQFDSEEEANKQLHDKMKELITKYKFNI